MSVENPKKFKITIDFDLHDEFVQAANKEGVYFPGDLANKIRKILDEGYNKKLAKAGVKPISVKVRMEVA